MLPLMNFYTLPLTRELCSVLYCLIILTSFLYAPSCKGVEVCLRMFLSSNFYTLPLARELRKIEFIVLHYTFLYTPSCEGVEAIPHRSPAQFQFLYTPSCEGVVKLFQIESLTRFLYTPSCEGVENWMCFS